MAQTLQPSKPSLERSKEEKERRVPKRHLDLFELCTWAYRDQLVDRVTGRGLFEVEREIDGQEPSGASGCGCATIARIASIGGRIDGGEWAHLNDRVHPDAVALHERATVVRHQAIGYFARLGEAPEWPMAIPRAWPELADRERDRGWNRLELSRYRHADEWRAVAGITTKLVDIRVLEAERWAETIRYREWDPRTRRTVARQRTEVHPVLYCPLNWSPSVEWIMAQQGTYRAWHDAMARLMRAMAGAVLRDHVVTGFSAPTHW